MKHFEPSHFEPVTPFSSDSAEDLFDHVAGYRFIF